MAGPGQIEVAKKASVESNFGAPIFDATCASRRRVTGSPIQFNGQRRSPRIVKTPLNITL